MSTSKPKATKRRSPIVRSPDDTTCTFNLPKDMKQSLTERAVDIDRPISQLIRWALEFQEKQGWKEIPLARRPNE